MKKLITVAFFCHLAIHSIAQNSTGMPAGDIGIGVTTPVTKLHVHNSTPAAMVGSESEVLRVVNFNTFDNQIKFLFRRHTAGNDWFGIASRIQFATNDVKQGFIEFNPGGNYLAGLAFGTNNTEAMRINTEGMVGIGTLLPEARMHVFGGTLGSNVNDKIKNMHVQNYCGSDAANVEFYAYRNANGNNWLTTSTRMEHNINGVKQGFIEFNPPGMLHGMALGTSNTQRIYITDAGQVGIGTTANAINNTEFKLYVETGIRTRKVKVDLLSWPDYVFHKDYNLLPLANVEKFIQQNGHLPEMPAAAEVEKEGLDLGTNQAALLKKIEELTLYIIEQNKEMQQMKAKMISLESKVNEQLKPKK